MTYRLTISLRRVHVSTPQIEHAMLITCIGVTQAVIAIALALMATFTIAISANPNWHLIHLLSDLVVI